MPHTINGIGTWYWFKSKIQTRRGRCRHCAREAELKSYDTGLWFVVFFLPVIPLGRKRVLDECGVCQMHGVLPLAKWEELSAKSIDDGMETFKKDPSIETALDVHARLLAFGRNEQADAFRAQTLNFFQSDHEFLREMAAQLDEAGRGADAETILHRVLAIKPDDWNARMYVGSRQTDRGELDAARKQLDFLTRPGAGKDHTMAPLARLAMAYSSRGRDNEALELFERSLVEAPEFGKDREFRDACAASEKRTGRSLGLLPRRRPSWLGVFNPWNPDYSPGARQAAGWAVFLTAVALGVLGFNEWVRRNRPLHVYNPFNKPMIVRIDGGEPIAVEPGYKTVRLKEGPHRIETIQPIRDDHEFTLQFPWWKRFGHNPFIGYSPRGSAMAMLQTVVYSQHNAPNDPPEFFPLHGVTVRDHVDFVMKEPPKSVDLPSAGAVARRTVVQHVPVPANVAASMLFARNDRDAAYRMAMAHAEAAPLDVEMLEMWRAFAMATHREAEAEQTLEKDLDSPETTIERHRTWSEFARVGGRDEKVAAYYDKRMAASPEDARWPYLRGRVEHDEAKSIELFQKSIALNPKFGWPRLALAYRAAYRAQWRECRTELEEAERLGVPAQILSQYKGDTRWATMTPKEMAAEASENLEDSPFDIEAAIRFSIATAASDPAAGKSAWDAFETKLRGAPGSTPAAVKAARIRWLYAAGDFDAAGKEFDNPPLVGPIDHAWHQLYVGRADAAVATPAFHEVVANHYGKLALAMSYELAGERAKAEAQIAEAVALLEIRGFEERAEASLLKSTTAPALQAVVDLQRSVEEKILVTTWLAKRFPESPELADFARKLNVGRDPMHQFLKRVLNAPGAERTEKRAQ